MGGWILRNGLLLKPTWCFRMKWEFHQVSSTNVSEKNKTIFKFRLTFRLLRNVLHPLPDLSERQRPRQERPPLLPAVLHLPLHPPIHAQGQRQGAIWNWGAFKFCRVWLLVVVVQHVVVWRVVVHLVVVQHVVVTLKFFDF